MRWHWRSADTHLVHSTGAGDSLVAAGTLFDLLQAEEPDLWTGWDGVRQTRTRPSIRALVATPLMVDGVLYLSTPLYQAAAVDARSGETLWVHDPRAYESGMPAIAQWRHRGVAYWRTRATPASCGPPATASSSRSTRRRAFPIPTSATTAASISWTACRAPPAASATS